MVRGDGSPNQTNTKSLKLEGDGELQQFCANMHESQRCLRALLFPFTIQVVFMNLDDMNGRFPCLEVADVIAQVGNLCRGLGKTGFLRMLCPVARVWEAAHGEDRVRGCSCAGVLDVQSVELGRRALASRNVTVW